MGHGLEIKADGTASMVSGRGMTPWHGLGEVKPGLMTLQECLEASGCDWTVSLRQGYVAVPRVGAPPRMVKVEGKYGVTRDTDNRVFGYVGGDYTPCQNADAFAFLDQLVDEGGAKFDTAGSLFGGKRVFVSILIPEAYKIAGESYDNYVLFSNTHDGTRGIVAAYTKIRTVCRNTESLALAQAKHTWSIHHRTTLEGKLAEARESLKLTVKYDGAFQQAVEAMIQKKVTDDKFEQMMRDAFPDQVKQQDANVKAVLENRSQSQTIENDWRQSAWGAFNALTEWQDHGRDYRTPDARMKYILLGDGNKFRNKIGQSLLAYSS